jgi:hypothetical protein
MGLMLFMHSKKKHKNSLLLYHFDVAFKAFSNKEHYQNNQVDGFGY